MHNVGSIHVYEFYKWLHLLIREEEEWPLIASAAPIEPGSQQLPQTPLSIRDLLVCHLGHPQLSCQVLR